ncbi:olfactory receptor 4S1 [Procambarus clarkii]|uniref:olfactory receptor 4S1 n=1 Tax=Procambarus clarkii TaxID=6728 RepID=UPI001E673BD9|nr:olfactory receptor 4S1-like [Procambarus clarkii]
MAHNLTDGVNTTGTTNIHILLYLYPFFSAVTFAECVLAGYITALSHDLRERLSSWFLSSLIVSIGIFSSLSFVYAIVLIAHPDVHHSSPAGCQVKLVQRYLSTVSCFTLTCLALDRYVAICWPLRYYNILTIRRCRLLCVACWMLPLVLLVLPCASVLSTLCNPGNDKEFLIAYSVAYVFGALTTFVFYILVALEFRLKSRVQPHDSNADMTEAMVRHKTAKSALQVFMFYILLSLPHALLPLMFRFLRKENTGPWLVVVGHLGHLVHRLHLLLFLPMYALANVSFFTSLKAIGQHLWRTVACGSSGQRQRQGPPKENSFALETTVGEF